MDVSTTNGVAVMLSCVLMLLSSSLRIQTQPEPAQLAGSSVRANSLVVSSSKATLSCTVAPSHLTPVMMKLERMWGKHVIQRMKNGFTCTFRFPSPVRLGRIDISSLVGGGSVQWIDYGRTATHGALTLAVVARELLPRSNLEKSGWRVRNLTRSINYEKRVGDGRILLTVIETPTYDKHEKKVFRIVGVLFPERKTSG